VCYLQLCRQFIESTIVFGSLLSSSIALRIECSLNVASTATRPPPACTLESMASWFQFSCNISQLLCVHKQPYLTLRKYDGCCHLKVNDAPALNSRIVYTSWQYWRLLVAYVGRCTYLPMSEYRCICLRRLLLAQKQVNTLCMATKTRGQLTSRYI